MFPVDCIETALTECQSIKLEQCKVSSWGSLYDCGFGLFFCLWDFCERMYCIWKEKLSWVQEERAWFLIWSFKILPEPFLSGSAFVIFQYFFLNFLIFPCYHVISVSMDSHATVTLEARTGQARDPRGQPFVLMMFVQLISAHLNYIILYTFFFLQHPEVSTQSLMYFQVFITQVDYLN